MKLIFETEKGQFTVQVLLLYGCKFNCWLLSLQHNQVLVLNYLTKKIFWLKWGNYFLNPTSFILNNRKIKIKCTKLKMQQNRQCFLKTGLVHVHWGIGMYSSIIRVKDFPHPSVTNPFLIFCTKFVLQNCSTLPKKLEMI